MNPVPLNDCGCCEGVAAETPARIANRGGLPAIAYRCGTYAQFKRSMLAALSSSTHPALTGLATREDDDFSIALLDAWAATADVLTFYQERIAQESYLRTATERMSLLQLGRLIGYELRPGVAASTHLAFTMETAPGAPLSAIIAVGQKVQSIPGPGERPQTFETVEEIEARPEWNELRVRHTQSQRIDANITELSFEGTGTQLRKGDALLFLTMGFAAFNPSWDLCHVQSIEVDHAKSVTRVTLHGRPTKLRVPAGGSIDVFAMRQRTGLFGHNAPDPRVLTSETRQNMGLSTQPGASEDWPFSVRGDALDLDGTYPTISAGSYVALTAGPERRALVQVQSAHEAGRRDYLLTAKVTRLSVTEPGRAEPADLGNFGELLRGTIVFAESEKLKLAAVPIAPFVSGGSLLVAQPIKDFQPGRLLAVTGRKAKSGALFGGIVKLVDAVSVGAETRIRFAPALPDLEWESIRLNANVALATHGETVGESLGGADASRSFQCFALRQPPLTHVRASNASGAKSTLQVRVNDLLWHEVPTLVGRGPHDRVFVTTTDDDGATTVQFGDGVTGARPPTGQDNVRSSYRRGIGLDGLVQTGQLTQVLSPPLGVRSVSNPVAAAGAANREELADARRSAPHTVLTLDRIVSLQDYEDFVRGFAGVAKALATWTWDGEVRGVFITVAGPGGAEIDLTGDFGDNLLRAIQQACVPGVPVRVQSYRNVSGLFTIAGRVKINPDHEADRVLSAVRNRLQTQFAFDARAFGEPVMLSEVIAAMQSTAGVMAVDVDELRRSDAPPGSPRLSPRLVAGVPQAGTRDGPSPAELLVLAPLAPDQIGVL